MTEISSLAEALAAPGRTAYALAEFPHYRITSDGQIFSLRSDRFLKPQRMGEYLGVMITNAAGVIVKRYMHRLVLEAVAGPCPPEMQARHLNGDRRDNRATNLAWGTREQNARDKVGHGTVTRGTKNGQAKLTWPQVREIRALNRGGVLQRRLAEKFGVSPMTISRIVRGESWRESMG